MRKRYLILGLGVGLGVILLLSCGRGIPTPTETPLYKITGSVTGEVIAQVYLNLSGEATKVTTTDAAGKYTLTDLANGTYTLTPTYEGYHFAPPSRTVTIESANLTAEVFSSAQNTYSISGMLSGGTSETTYISAKQGTNWNEWDSLPTVASASVDAGGTIYTLSPKLLNGSYMILALQFVGHSPGSPEVGDYQAYTIATLEGRDLTNANLALSRLSSVSGTIEGGTTNAAIRVLLLDPSFQSGDPTNYIRYYTAINNYSAANKTFTFQNVTEGNYKLWTFSDDDGDQDFDEGYEKYYVSPHPGFSVSGVTYLDPITLTGP